MLVLEDSLVLVEAVMVMVSESVVICLSGFFVDVAASDVCAVTWVEVELVSANGSMSFPLRSRGATPKGSVIAWLQTLISSRMPNFPNMVISVPTVVEEAEGGCER